MRNPIRLPSVVFALLSALYWSGIAQFWSGLTGAYAEAYRTSPPGVVSWLIRTVPTIVYALICVLFCHWLAKRVLRLSAPKEIG